MTNNSYTYSEVLDVLEKMDTKYINLLPQKLVEFFRTNESSEYKKHIKTDVELKNQQLSQKALSILAVINLKYWVSNEEHKKELIERYTRNSKGNVMMANQEIFKKTEKSGENISHNQSIVVVKRRSIFDKIINFFRRNKNER